MREIRVRFWFETFLAAVSGLLAVLTLITRDWIEVVFGVDPDQHSGSLEVLIVLIFASIFLAATLLARDEWRRPRGVET